MPRLALVLVLGASGCGSDPAPTCEARADPAATVAVDAVLAAADAATVVDVSVGGLEDWTYTGSDDDQATIDAFRAVFAALDEPPWDACVTYEETGLSSMYTTFGDCPATDATPAIDGTVHVEMDAEIDAGEIALSTRLVATGVLLEGADLSFTASFTWDPTPEEAGVRSQVLAATVTLPSGDEVSIAGDVGLDADPSCQRIEGDLATVGHTLAVAGFEECLGRCPSAGGSISYDGDDGPVEIELDGSATAHAHSACGSFEVPLDCGL